MLMLLEIRYSLKFEQSTSTMKFLIALALFAVVSCEVAQVIPIVKSSYENNPDGGYHYEYESGNGIAVQAEGVVKNPNSEQASISVRGGYVYKNDDGSPVEVTYVADENGFQPQGAHLPVGPAIPEAILRSLEYIAAHPPKEEKPFSG